MRIISPRRSLVVRRCNTRTSGTRDGAVSGHRNAGRAAAWDAPPCSACGARASCAWKFYAWVRPLRSRPLVRAEHVLKRLQRLPAGVGDGCAIARTGVQILAALRADSLAIIPAYRVPRRGEDQLLAHGRRDVNVRRVRCNGIRIWVVLSVRILRKQRPDFELQRRLDGGQTAPAFPCDHGARRALPIEPAISEGL